MRPSGQPIGKASAHPLVGFFMSLIYDHLQGDSQMLLKRRPRSQPLRVLAMPDIRGAGRVK